MTTMYLIRHGEAEGNVYRRFHGWYDSRITPKGYSQVEALERRFDGVPIDAVYASPLFRAMTTAGAIYKPRGLPLRTDPDLREIGGGVWEDRPWGELCRKDPALLEAFFRADPGWGVEGGETYIQVQTRMGGVLRRIAGENEGKTVAVFSHGTAIMTALALFRGYPPEAITQMPHGDNTAVSKLLFRSGEVEIEFFNDASHLGPLAAQGGRGSLSDFMRRSLWFRPLDLKSEAGFYRKARREAWATIHHTMRGFNAGAFLSAARDNSDYDPRSVVAAMCGDRRAGILQMDLRRGAEEGWGTVPFFYMMPEYRAQGLGVQLLGQAVSVFRTLGRRRLRLRCAPENLRARRFYERQGFHKIGEEPGGLGTLDLLEKDI